MTVNRNTESMGDFCSQNFMIAVMVELHGGEGVWRALYVRLDFISSNTLSLQYINITISGVLHSVVW